MEYSVDRFETAVAEKPSRTVLVLDLVIIRTGNSGIFSI